jgi:hypothetical protein
MIPIAMTIAVLAATGPPSPAKEIWPAICYVESRGNPTAWNAAESAAGIAQIRPVVVADCNRILGQTRFTLASRWDPREARAMFDLYTGHYSRGYAGDRAEIAARIWNGGPRGPRKPSTARYWAAVQAARAPGPATRGVRTPRSRPARPEGQDDGIPASRPGARRRAHRTVLPRIGEVGNIAHTEWPLRTILGIIILGSVGLLVLASAAWHHWIRRYWHKHKEN